MKTKITAELFAIPNRGRYIIYAPLKRVAVEVNPPAIAVLQKIGDGSYDHRNPELIERLSSLGILEPTGLENRCENQTSIPKTEISPTSTTLFPTTDCNLRCRYCYASGGDTSIYMSLEIAQAAVDFIVSNALRKKEKGIRLGFHGGGEPFCNFEMIRRTVEYAKEESRERKLDLRTSVATNGVLNKDQLSWIPGNIERLNVSLDGPEDIQNAQRPTKEKGSSFREVMNTLSYLEQHKVEYGIRTTITSESVNEMMRIFNFLKDATPVKSFHFEPLFECGRCKTTREREPEPGLFLEKLIEVRGEAVKAGREVYYSAGRFGSATQTFCGAAEGGFNVSPKGLVTSCFEVSDEKDPRARTFVYGAYKNGKFEFYPERLTNLRRRTVDNLPHCKDCFAKFSCAGDCLAKVESQGDMFDTSKNARCEINRGILLDELNRRLKTVKNDSNPTTI